ncbi:MAG: gag protein [Campylobacter sp.]|nr:gag protein [Campylobacter sp.]
MIKIHQNVLVKKTRYDLNMSIENASKFEQLCEAYQMPKSQMADLIIDSFCQGNPIYKSYLENFRTIKKRLKAKTKQDINLFKSLDDSND